MFALFCIFLTIAVLGGWYIGDYYGKREAEKRKHEPMSEDKKITTFYPCGAKIINEKGEVVGTLYRGEAVIMHFLLNHKDKKLSTAELSNATGIPSGGPLFSLERHGWILFEKNDNDYYKKVLLTEEGKKVFLEAL